MSGETESGPAVLNALALSHRIVRGVLRPGDLAVDATAGNGHDTAFLAGLVGPEGRVLAFDVQEEAVRRTRERLAEGGLLDRCLLFAEGHENLETRIAALDATWRDRGVAAAMFNLGWLPGADHRIGTQARTTIPALRQAMARIRPGGVVTVALYYGRESGYEERDALLAFAAEADVRTWAVQKAEIWNARNDAPIFLCFERLAPGTRRAEG